MVYTVTSFEYDAPLVGVFATLAGAKHHCHDAAFEPLVWRPMTEFGRPAWAGYEDSPVEWTSLIREYILGP